MPVIAFTPHWSVACQLQLVWGVWPHVFERLANAEEMIVQADYALTRSGMVQRGDIVVVTFGAPVALCGSTNLMKLHRIGEVDIG